MQTEQDLLNVKNQNYLSIVYEIVQKDKVFMLLKWVNSLTDTHKKSLRVLKTIIDVKGKKKFKQ